MTTLNATMSPHHERRRRSASLIGHLKQDSVEVENDQFTAPNPNVSWIKHKGAWLIHIVLIALLLVVYDAIPSVSSEWTWTLTNGTYVIATYLMFHYFKGVPFDFNAGAFDSLTMWEQLDNGDQYTPSKKFLLGVPVTLFLISTHFAHYDLVMFIVNFIFCLVGVLPKLPFSHRLRFIVDEDEEEPKTVPSHLKLDSLALKN